MTGYNDNHNDVLGKRKAVRGKMKEQLEEHFKELSSNPTPKRRQKLDMKVEMMREALTDNLKMIEKERNKHDNQ